MHIDRTITIRPLSSYMGKDLKTLHSYVSAVVEVSVRGSLVETVYIVGARTRKTDWETATEQVATAMQRINYGTEHTFRVEVKAHEGTTIHGVGVDIGHEPFFGTVWSLVPYCAFPEAAPTHEADVDVREDAIPAWEDMAF
jgi:hypothetical protein